MSLSCDDLGTRSEAVEASAWECGRRNGSWAPRGRRRWTHLRKANPESVPNDCWHSRHSLPRHRRIRRFCGNLGYRHLLSAKEYARNAVIARCGMERSAACRSGAKGNNTRWLHLWKGEAKSLSFRREEPQRGSRKEKAQCLC